MEVEFVQEREDYQDYQRYHKEHGPRLAPVRKVIPGTLNRIRVMSYLLLVLVIVLGGLIFTFQGVIGKRTVDTMFEGLQGAFAVVVLLCLGVPIVQGFYSEKRACDQQRVHLALTPEGIHARKGMTEKLTRWAGIVAVGVTNQHLFLYTGPTIGYVVPRRAFPDGRAFHAFADRVCDSLDADSAARFADRVGSVEEGIRHGDKRVGDHRTKESG